MYSSGGLIKPHGGKLSFLFRILDGLLVFVSLRICGWIFNVEMHDPYWFAIAWAVILFLLIAESKGLYQSWRLAPISHEAGQVMLVWAMVFVLLVILAFFTKTSVIYSRLVIFSWMLLTPTLLVIFRLIVRLWLRELRKHGHNTRTLAIAGTSASAQKLLAQIQATPWLGFKIAGIYDDSDAPHQPLGRELLPLRGDLSQMVADVRTEAIDFVYIALPMHAENRIVQLIDALADTTASVYIIPDFFVFDLLHARWFNLGGLPIVSVFESPFHGVDGWLKRTEDLLLGGLILLFISPVLLLVALAVKFSSPGPIIFKQRRYGLNGQIVEVWKFRSMTVCEDGDHIPQAQKVDTRITPLGAFLRRTSLDELPQFFNVLQGGMSIVGPRPHAVAHNEQYRRLIHGYMLRHKIKPGITGWAQVNGWRGETDTLEKMEKRIEFDLAYMRNWSLWLDIKIIWLTIWKGFSGKNAY
jgi:putative colanic acid biosynthesis UDP-glucose lipid carrier transferase